MIEVEKKFLLSDVEHSTPTKDAVFLGERTFTDVYYDTPDYTLTTRDIWLRSRDGRFELKTPIHSGAERLADQYRESEDESEIIHLLEISLGAFLETPLSKNFEKHHLAPFCKCTTTRKKYKKGVFTIDLDTVEYGDDFTYTIGEIERMVSEELAVKDALHSILVFAEKHNLTIAPVRGKVVEYLRRKNKKHYHALIDAGIFQR